MSSYADYAQISRDFDKTRRPVGTGLLLKALRQVPTALNRMAVLDAGCGTGSYCKALDGVVGSITGVDLNPKMIGVARRKFDGGARKTRVSFELGSVTSLPFDDGRFGAVMVNQVLHHLPDHPRAGYPMHRAAIREFARVLKPGGEIAILEFSQVRGALFGPLFRFYFRFLLPKLGSLISGVRGPYQYLPASVSRFPERESLSQTMRECGFESVAHRDLTGGVVTLHRGTRPV